MQKENANFCEYWHGDHSAFKPTHKTSGSEAKAKLDALFGRNDDKGARGREENADAGADADQPSSAEEKAKAELQALFGAPNKQP
jgi:hypothetical protein|tara:strand:+ start:6015 stop:6269 length:255 start_codon:yes stop_codon:yes gene_type:complete